MRTTRRTGPWWFMQEISKIINKKPPASDGEYFIYNNRIIKQKDILPILRSWYAYLLLLKRFVRKRGEQHSLRYWLNHKARPGQIYTVITYKRINEIYPQLAAIKKRLEKLPNPYGIEFTLEY